MITLLYLNRSSHCPPWNTMHILAQYLCSCNALLFLGYWLCEKPEKPKQHCPPVMLTVEMGRFGMCTYQILASSETPTDHYGLCLLWSPFGFIVWMPLHVRGSVVAGYTHDLYSQTVWFWILPSPFISCVTLCIIFNHLVARFLHLEHGTITLDIIILVGFWWT